MRKAIRRWLQENRLALGRAEAAPIATLLGAIVGALSGLAMVLFRYLIELPMGEQNEAQFFHSLDIWQRALLPLTGAAVIALIAYRLKPDERDTGVGHVIDRMQNHQGIMPARNAFYQFVAGAIAMMSGHSVGREGPAVHIGASISSRVATFSNLPKNFVRILVGCGVAAAIGASFNTPIAGVIFAMEVVLLEYTIVGFLPIIMASVIGTLMYRIFYGDSPAFIVGAQSIGELSNLAFFIACGIVIGILATAFIKLRCEMARFSKIPLYARLLAAGIISAVGAMLIPDIMGSGYPQLQQAINSELSWQLALTLVAGKLIFTAIVIGLGLPGGLIATTLVIGGCLGFVLAYVLNLEAIASSFTLVGMAAMMGAVLNAPLAALLAVFELTYNPHLILPAMLTIVVANNVSRLLNERNDIFRAALHRSGTISGQEERANPLRSIAVTAVQSTAFKISKKELTTQDAEALLATKPTWIIVKGKKNFKFAMSAADLARYLATRNTPDNIDYPTETVTLSEIPAERIDCMLVDANESASQALKQLASESVELLIVANRAHSPSPAVIGVVTEQHLKNYYLQGI